MKKIKLCFLFFALIFSGMQSFSEEIKLTEGKETKLTIKENNYSNLRLTNSIANLNYFNVKTSPGIFSQITVDGYGYSLEIGDPKLPVLKKVIEVPIGSYFEINIIKENYLEYDLSNFGITNKIIPAQPSVSKSIDNPEDLEFVINQSTYQTNDYLGSDLVTVNYLGKMRGVSMARLEISPFQYNPVLNKIKVCYELEVEINFIGGDLNKTIQLKKDLFSPYFEGVYNLFANYKEEITDELIMDEPVTFIIVSDPMFQAALQPYIEWKTKKGFYVIEAYTNDPAVGNTTTSIKSYLQDFYNNPPAGYNSQSFVLFVGDVAQIPAFSGTAGSHITDLYYCEYTGDIFPECYYGRFSANNLTELQPQIDKTLEYEQYLMPDPSFLDEVVMVAGADASHALTWGNGQINYGTTYYFNAAHGLYSHTYLQPEPGGGNYSANIRQNVSDGVAYANYTAHCSSSGWADPNFVTSHIPALTNSGKYPLMIGNCCSSVTFGGTCFGEEILRAADKGAFGYIGGSNSTYWDEDFWWGVGYEAISANPVYNPANLGAYDRTFHDNGEILDEWYVTQGQMPSAGNLAVTQAGSSLETYYWEIYHLMGDPSLMVYMSQPPVTSATYDALMPLGTTSFTVNTEAYAYVGITKDGVLHGAAIADASGIAEVTMNPPITVPGTADIVVTRQNGQPYIGTVTVASSSGPYLSLESYQIDDNAGNNNGEADYGEDIALNVTLENLGNSTATNVSATLFSSDPYITITDNSNNWPDIPDGATSTQTGAFAFTVADDVPDQHTVTFDLEMTDGSETWNSSFSITINAPLLENGNITIDDVSGGNGNGRLDPGETADIIIQTLNNGHSISPDASATLISGSPWITINSGSSALGKINAGSFANALFNITCDAATPVGTVVDLTMDVAAGNYGFSHTYYESVGLILEDWETGDFSRFPWTFAGNADWFLTTVDPYEGIYCAQSGTITDNQTSELVITVETTADDDISFYRKVSSENNCDYLQFWIDGTMQEQWAGEVPWGQASYPVTTGLHTFKWIYDKDYSISNGSDCGWIDIIVFPPLAPVEPDIAVAPTYIDFGDVMVGGEAAELFTISNNGTDNLTGTISTPAGYSVSEATKKAYKFTGENALNFLISPGGSQDFILTFEPKDIQCYSDIVTIASNDPDSPVVNLVVAGCGVEGPNIVYNPSSFDKTLAPDNYTTDILNIENDGGLDLEYTATVVYSKDNKDDLLITDFDSGIPGDWTIIDGGETTDTWFGATDYNGSTLNGTPFAFVNSDAAGYFDMDEQLITPEINTSGYTSLTLEFDHYFNFYSYGGVEKGDVDICDGSNWQNIYSVNSNVGSWSSPDHQAIDILSYANANLKVRFHYYDANYDWYWAVDNVLVSGTPGPTGSWLTLNGGNMVNGSLIPGTNTDINVGFDAAGLSEGVYYADINISSNDPVEPQVIVPCTLQIISGITVDLKIFLEGPFNGSEMNTDLSLTAEFPLTQPFNVAPWNYNGTESIPVVPNADVVDWVLVELRDADIAQNATGSTVIETQACLLLNDGSIVSVNGSSNPLFNNQPYQNLFAVIYSRNHLPVLSNNPLTETEGMYTYDFSTGEVQVFGGSLGYKELVSGSGIWGMVGGDGNCNGEITIEDKTGAWESDTGNSGYNINDHNMDGQIDNRDKNDYILLNIGKVSQMPE